MLTIRVLPRLIALTSLLAAAAAAAAGCYQPAPPQSTFPEPTAGYGPPGGGIDPGWGYAQPGYAGPDDQGSTDQGSQGQGSYDQGSYDQGSYDPGSHDPGSYDQGAYDAQPAASADPASDGYVLGSVTDAEIDTTLAPYGEWTTDAEYGRVWRPSVTVVGADFTPYESCGRWIYTDYGWTFSCEWDWGWLPFHYGRWAYLDTGWGWVPDYTWGPGWVDWRHGGGYVGWRPSEPTRRIRDHRDRGGRSTIRDHRRRDRDAHWRFSSTDRFGSARIRDHVVIPPNGLGVTTTVSRPPVRGQVQGRAAAVMASRMKTFRAQDRWRATPATQPGIRGERPTWNRPQPGVRGERPTWNRPQPGVRGERPTWNQPQPGVRGERPTWNRPQPGVRGDRVPPSRGGFGSPSSTPPSRGSYPPPSRGSYSPPSRGSYNPPRSSSPPSRGSYSPPSRSSSPPSRSSSSPSRSSGGSRRR